MGAPKPGSPGNDGETPAGSRRPHHSTIVAWLALFIALGGVAAGLPGRNNVGSNDIKPGAVHARDIHRDAVKASKIAEGAVKTNALAAGAVTPGQIGGVPAARVDTPQEGEPCEPQVIGNQTEVIKFTDERFAAPGMWVPPPDDDCSGDAQSRLTATLPGVYLVSTGLAWPANDQHRRTVRLLRNGVEIAADTRMAVDGAETDQSLATLAELDADDYVEADVTQTSGSDLTLANATDTYLAIAWIAPTP